MYPVLGHSPQILIGLKARGGRKTPPPPIPPPPLTPTSHPPPHKATSQDIFLFIKKTHNQINTQYISQITHKPMAIQINLKIFSGAHGRSLPEFRGGAYKVYK
ncbi:ORF4 [Pitorquevirus ursid8]|uniref:ORF4 n=1 Tax=Giant panda anellovirus TaxID=2016460 RepID=A0A220IGI5_9VIRU|nr:ORF4 [Giant panda anellovirus]ASH99088.1 ORF4 [Giant panda anellovirus]